MEEFKDLEVMVCGAISDMDELVERYPQFNFHGDTSEGFVYASIYPQDFNMFIHLVNNNSMLCWRLTGCYNTIPEEGKFPTVAITVERLKKLIENNKK